MAFEATKREWGELYAFFRLLADGCVYAGTPEVKRNEGQCLPVAMVQREEHDGTRRYIVEKEMIHIVGEQMDKRIPREDFGTVADLVLEAIRNSREDDVTSPDGVEEFLDEIAVYDLEAKTDDRTDFYVTFWDMNAPKVGFRVYSKLAPMNPLLDGGRTANLKFEQTGVRFATPTVNKVNFVEGPNEVLERMRMIERLGGVLKYSDVADKVFRSNLSMIDLHFPRMLAEMVRTMYYEDITKVSELTMRIKEINPLKIKDELINKHLFYEYKMKQFLVALALVCVYFYYKRWDYNSMEAGEDVARGLGVDIRSTRVLGLVFSAVITAIVVSFMGIIGFIGLIAPHIVKRLIGDDFRYLLTGSMLVGALVLLLSNIVGSYAFGMSVPVGIITSFIGGPVFIYILIRGYRRRSTV